MHRVRSAGVAVAALALVGMVAATLTPFVGCGGTHPIVALQLASNLGGQAGGGGNIPPDDDDDTDGRTISSICDLDTQFRFMQITVFNAAQQYVRYAVTLVATAGSGGFVCEDQEPFYLNAGYREAPLQNGGTVIGCDFVQLRRGTKLLTLRLTGTIAPRPGADGDDDFELGPVADRPLNGAAAIPVPELIVFGNEDTAFTCLGNELCTQRGFVYSDIAGTPITAVNASRIQDTICNARTGTAPEWRLGGLNALADGVLSGAEILSIAPTQYVAGGRIVVVVGDRAANANPNVNQVVWEVTGPNEEVIHQMRP